MTFASELELVAGAPAEAEGELQMLTVLGLMRITREDHCLFLLDEPDTHLNPIWKLRYFDDIEGVLSSEKDSLVQGESQILITTHDPMMVGSLKREQVHILRKRRELSVVESPRTIDEDVELTRLSSELAGLGFSTADFRDPDYALFVRKMAQHRRFRKSVLSPEEQAEQDRIADEIIDEILREEDSE